MSELNLSISLVNATEGHRFSDFYEPVDDLRDEDGAPDVGAIFRECRREYGRCIGKVYNDTRSRGTIATGWVFVSRQPYDGDRSGGRVTYLRESWVSLVELDHEAMEQRSVQIGGAP